MQTASMNSSGVTVGDSPTPANLFDEFEEAFQNCLAPLTKEDPLNGINQDELRANAEANSQKFLELAQRMEASFLQKRFLLSVQKPEMLLMEENQEMRHEIARKDDLIKKMNEKLGEWQGTLLSVINRLGAVPSYGQRGPSAIGTPNVMASGSPVQMMNTQSMGSPIMSGPKMPSPSQVPISGMGSSMSMGGMNHAPHILGSVQSPLMGQMGKVGTSNGHQMSPSMSQSPYQSVGGMGSPSGPQMGPSSNMGSPMGPGSQSSSGGSMYHGGPSQGPIIGHSPNHPSSVGLQGPLAFLEKTTTNIGIPDSRRQ